MPTPIVLTPSLQQTSPLAAGQHGFKLSLCGASAISQDAVSALLRLPLLSGLDLEGCHRISSIDKMRLSAKVRSPFRVSSSPLLKNGPRLG